MLLADQPPLPVGPPGPAARPRTAHRGDEVPARTVDRAGRGRRPPCPVPEPGTPVVPPAGGQVTAPSPCRHRLIAIGGTMPFAGRGGRRHRPRLRPRRDHRAGSPTEQRGTSRSGAEDPDATVNDDRSCL